MNEMFIVSGGTTERMWEVKDLKLLVARCRCKIFAKKDSSLQLVYCN